MSLSGVAETPVKNMNNIVIEQQISKHTCNTEIALIKHVAALSASVMKTTLARRSISAMIDNYSAVILPPSLCRPE